MSWIAAGDNFPKCELETTSLGKLWADFSYVGKSFLSKGLALSSRDKLDSECTVGKCILWWLRFTIERITYCGCEYVMCKREADATSSSNGISSDKGAHLSKAHWLGGRSTVNIGRYHAILTKWMINLVQLHIGCIILAGPLPLPLQIHLAYIGSESPGVMDSMEDHLY